MLTVRTDDDGKTPYDDNLPSTITELLDLKGKGDESEGDEEEQTGNLS
jgi:hypothetical protein